MEMSKDICTTVICFITIKNLYRCFYVFIIVSKLFILFYFNKHVCNHELFLIPSQEYRSKRSSRQKSSLSFTEPSMTRQLSDPDLGRAGLVCHWVLLDEAALGPWSLEGKAGESLPSMTRQLSDPDLWRSRLVSHCRQWRGSCRTLVSGGQGWWVNLITCRTCILTVTW